MLNAVGSGTVDVSTFVVGDLAVSAVFAYNVAAGAGALYADAVCGHCDVAVGAGALYADAVCDVAVGAGALYADAVCDVAAGACAL